MKHLSTKFIKEYYDVRSAIYTLFISASLLFLLNLRAFNVSLKIYVLMLCVLVIVSMSEFFFSVEYAGKIYHKNHPLHDLFRRVKTHHMYNVALLPVMQYVCCALLIYYTKNTFLSLALIIVTSVVTYGTFVCYQTIYLGKLQVGRVIEDFFDLSRYLSFAFITYLMLSLHVYYFIPRSVTALLLGCFQLIYIVSALWRKRKLNPNYLAITTVVSVFLSMFTYIYLVLFPVINHVGEILFIAANIIVLDYLFTSLILKAVDKKLNYYVFLEYSLVSAILILLLYFSR